MTPHNPISPKVKAGAGGGGAGFMLAIILVWILTMFGVEVPGEVGSAIGSLLSTGLGALSAYVKKDPLRGDYTPQHAN